MLFKNPNTGENIPHGSGLYALVALTALDMQLTTPGDLIPVHGVTYELVAL